MSSECESLRRKFKQQFDLDAELCVIVPGRVNIIGEHVDYSGFPVLPMALKRNVIVAAALRKSCTDSSSINLVNTDSTHPPYQRSLVSPLSIDYMKEGWGSYFLCGVRGALEAKSNSACFPPGDFLALVSGTIPPGAGLSSSSALVCAAFLTTANLYQIDVTMSEAASRCASCERYIGTEGGGMDQAIALLASPGCAKLVEFEPELKTTDVCLPNDAVFVVAHSQATKNKAASSEFNTRVAECRIAAQILAKRAGLDWRKVRKLKHVLDALSVPLDLALHLVSQHLPRSHYTKQQICEELEVSEDELDNTSLSTNTRCVDHFKLGQRALHVFQEANRVYQWHDAAAAGDTERLGKLMSESHKSLKDLYECSHDKVDSLVEACMSAGALGARITGAGWGGCVVALTSAAHVDGFIQQIKDDFYGNKDCDDLIFQSPPAPGAFVHRFT